MPVLITPGNRIAKLNDWSLYVNGTYSDGGLWYEVKDPAVSFMIKRYWERSGGDYFYNINPTLLDKAGKEITLQYSHFV